MKCKEFTYDRDRWWLSQTECLNFARHHRRGWDFGYTVSTDGVSVSICLQHANTAPWTLHPSVIAGPAPSQPVEGVVGQNPGNLATASRIVGIDPGKISIFTAVVHSQQADQTLTAQHPVKYETVHWTTGRWKEDSGANYRQARVDKWLRQSRGVRRLIRGTPSAKVASSQAFRPHITHKLQHHSTISSHFYAKRYKTLRWSTYISQQRAMATMITDVTGNNADTVLAFGNADFAHNSKGRVSSLTKGFKNKLAASCRFFELDEHMTSKLCCACNDANGMAGMGLGTGEITQAITCMHG